MRATTSAGLRVLVVEAEALLRERLLLPRLREQGFDAGGADSAATLQQMLAVAVPELLVLDVGLPDAAGFELARSLRQRLPRMGLVILSSCQDDADHIRALMDGADAYLNKPDDLHLLGATLYSVARRLQLQPAQASWDCAADWRLDANEWRLLAPCGQAVALTRSERPLMRCLIERRGEVVARDVLISLVAGNVQDYDPHRLESLIHRLRRKVAGACAQALPLIAVHGEGYVLTL